jgi:cell division initiation protein
MNYTSNDLQNLTFKKSLVRGYCQESVNEALYKIIEDYNSFLNENIELKDKVVMLNEGIRHYKNIEESLQNSLIVAQQTSEELKRNAVKQAENIVKEAELKSKEIIEEAKREVMKIRVEFEETRKTLHVYKAKSENLLMSQLEILKLVQEEAIT